MLYTSFGNSRLVLLSIGTYNISIGIYAYCIRKYIQLKLLADFQNQVYAIDMVICDGVFGKKVHDDTQQVAQ